MARWYENQIMKESSFVPTSFASLANDKEEKDYL